MSEGRSFQKESGNGLGDPSSQAEWRNKCVDACRSAVHKRWIRTGGAEIALAPPSKGGGASFTELGVCYCGESSM